ncbi:uncharacterized protein G2W53_003393 [Senna tora]|uniref:Uncharacterized protein n=1 Tax=Senna tora TaxID=362788 RepID=A0A835CIE0_9FABA|nr:uncharacterized protein G2W53_003393 [Senna tora]
MAAASSTNRFMQIPPMDFTSLFSLRFTHSPPRPPPSSHICLHAALRSASTKLTTVAMFFDGEGGREKRKENRDGAL